MAQRAGQDRLTQDIRAELKRVSVKGGRYFSGTARMFLDSTTDVVSSKMPTMGAMIDTNKGVIDDTLRFLRNPVDAIHRGIDKINQNENVKAMRKFAADALDDLKTGNIYDPDRDRSGFGTSIDSLLDDFGDFDMGGFDAEGEYSEPDVADWDKDAKMLESHEEAQDVRTVATIEAVEDTGKAIVSNANLNSQTDIRLGIKQHTQLMGSMSNVITQQGALLDSVNAMASSLLEVQREAHADVMASLNTIASTLNDIKTQTGPPTKEEDARITSDSVFGSNGELDVRKWLSTVRRNADEKYGISSAISMATMGMSPKQLIELVADNPWKLVSDQIVNKVIPDYLKSTMETTQKYMENFFPSLLAKWAEQGKQFDKDPSEGGGRLRDLIAGIFGVQPKRGGMLDLTPQNMLGQATFTNKFTQSVEQVIPMWLSKIYSAVSGDDLSMWNYTKGELQSVSRTVSENIHDSNDLVARMGSGARSFMSRATDKSAFQFIDPDMQKNWENYLYRFMQRVGENGSFLNYMMDEDQFKAMMPDDVNKDLWYKMITATLSHMPRNEVMALNSEINRARFSQRQADERIAADLRDSGMDITHAMIDKDLKSAIETNTVLYRRGLSDEQMIDLQQELQKQASDRGKGFHATNEYLNEITSILKRGIITFTHIIGNGELDPNSTVGHIYDQVKSAADDESTRITRIRTREEQEKTDKTKRHDDDVAANRLNAVTDRANNKVWIRDPKDIDQTSLDLAQGSLVIGKTKDGTSDSAKTEEQRLREDRERKIRGLAEGQIGRVRSAFNFNDDDTFGQKVQKMLESPFALVDLGLRTVDQFLFKIIYGEDAPPTIDDPDHPERDQKARSLMNVITKNMKAQWVSTKEWFKEYVGDPLKDFFIGDQGLFGKIKSRIEDAIIEPAAKKVGEIKDRVKGKLFGTQEIIEKYVDDPEHPGEKKLVKEKGAYSGGVFSDTLNRLHDLKGDVKARGLGWFDTFLYDDQYGKANKGRSYVADDIELDDEGRQVITEGHYQYHGAVGAAREIIDNASNTIKQWLFGPDENGNDYDSKKKFEDVKAEVKKAFPDMTIGAGIGLIGSFFLPGGPVLGSILGATGGLVAGSDRLKNYLFGEEEDDHETTKYNWKTGQIETVKGKGRKGGIINSEIQDAFKKYAPKMAIGAGIGVIGSMFLPGGPIIGSLLGATGGMVAASDRLKQVLFGDGTLNEDGTEKGLLPPSTRKKIVEAVKKNAPGIIGGAIGGAKLGSMLGAGLGLIPGLSLLPTGPIFTMLGGITGAIGGKTIQEYFFGEETEEVVTDPETGETKTVKKRVGGLFGKAYDYVQNKLFTPFGEKMTKLGDSVKSWFNTDVVGPLAHATEPLKAALENTKNEIADAFRHMGDHIKDSLDRVFENAFGKKMGEFFEEKIKKPLTNMVGKILGGIGKAIGAVISAPFKLLDYLVTGNTDKVDEYGSVIDNVLDSDETANDRRRSKKKSKGRKTLLQRFMDWRDKGTEEVNESMRNARRYWDPDEETGEPKLSDREQARLAGEAYKEQMRAEREARREKRRSMFASVKERFSGFFKKSSDSDADDDLDGAPTPAPTRDLPIPETRAQKRERLRKEKEEARAKRQQDKADAKAKRKEEKEARKAKREKGPNDSVGEPTDASTNADVQKGKQKGRNAVSYLKSIDKTLNKIYGELHGNINNVGWNIAYIKSQFDKRLGKLKPEEYSDDMDGSTRRGVNRRRTIIGRAIDSVKNFGGRVADRVGDMKDAAVDAVKGAVGAVIKPFKILGKAVGETAKALWSFGGTLTSILGEIAKGFAQGLGKILKGAGELLGRTMGAIGKTLWNAGAGIGKALGNTLSLVSDVVKNFGSAVAAGIAGVVEVAATVVPDVAKGIWGAMKGTAKGLWKGIKWGGKTIAKGGKWLWDKVTGKDKHKKREEVSATRKISETIRNGYMAIGIGDKNNVQPYPFIRFAGSKLLTKLNDTAIPVWIMGSSEDDKGKDDSVPNDVPVETPKRNFYSQDWKDADSMDFNDEQKAMIDEQFDKSRDIVGKYGDVFGNEFRYDPEFYKNYAEDLDRNPVLGNVDANVATIMSHQLSGDAYKPVVDKLEAINTTISTFYSAWSGYVPAGQSDNAVPSGNAPGQKELPAATPKSVPNLLESNPKVAAAGKQEEQENFKDWKQGYIRTDRKAERSDNPAEVYDKAIQHARSRDEVEGIIAAEAMNDGGGLMALNGKNGIGVGSGEEDSGGSLWEALFGGDGNGLLETALAGAGGAGIFATIKALFKNGLKRFGTTVAKNLPFAIGTYKEAKEGDYMSVGENVVRQSFRSWIPYWLKSAAGAGEVFSRAAWESVDDVMKNSKNANKIGAKLIVAFSENLDKLANNKVILGCLNRINPKWGEAFTNCLGGINSKFTSVVAKMGTEEAQVALKQVGKVVEVAMVLIDYFSGKERAGEYFKVSDYEVTNAMRETSGIVNAISGFCFGILPESWLCDHIYKALVSEEEKARIDEAQAELKEKTKQHNIETGEQLTEQQYAKKYNEDGTKKTWDQRLGGFVGNVFTSIPGINSIQEGIIEIGQRYGWFDRTKNPETWNPIVEAFQGDHRDYSEQEQIVRSIETLRRFMPGVDPNLGIITDPTAAGSVMIKYTNADNLFAAAQLLKTTFPDNASAIDAVIAKYENTELTNKSASDFIAELIDCIPKEKTYADLADNADEVNSSFGQFVDSLGQLSYNGSAFGRAPLPKSEWLKDLPNWGTGRVTPMDQTAAKYNLQSKEMSKVGCGPTAAAMVGSVYGDRRTPDVANSASKAMGMRAPDGGTNPNFFSQYAQGKGYGMSRGVAKPDSIAANLAKGQPVITMGEGGSYGENMHYLVADKVTGKDNVSVVDPIGGTRKNVSMEDLVGNAKEAIYSYGKGPVPAMASDIEGGYTGDTAAAMSEEEQKAAQVAEAQNALVSQMDWLSKHPIRYSLGDIQDPDQGVASCASTVGWAYRKALGVTGMSASSTEQSKDPKFTTIWVNDGRPLDTSILKPGDVLYQHWGQTKNTGAMKHTEMYAGNNKDLSHGGGKSGNERGPVYKDLDTYRKQHTMMVRRYTPLITGEDIAQINARGGTFGGDGVNYGSFGSFRTYDSSGATRDSNGNLKFELGTDGNFTFLTNLTSFFGDVTSKLTNAINNVMGIKTSDSETDDSGTYSGTTPDSNFVPAPGGSVTGTDTSAQVYNYLRGVGFNPTATAGIMGNLDAESGIRPDNVQDTTYAPNLSYAEEDKKYINDVTSGAHDFVHDSKGYGLAQWTYYSRKQGLWDLIRSQNATMTDLGPQLQHLWNEINSYQLAAPLNNASSIKEASNIMLHDFEAPSDQSASVENYRADLSQKWYDLYAKNETPDPESTDSNATGAEVPESTDGSMESMYAGAGKGWGAGPGGESLGLESLNYTIANLNDALSKKNSEIDSETSMSAITRKITESIDNATGGTANDAMFQAMVASMAQMVQLLTTIAENTKKSDEKDPLVGGRSSPRDEPRINQFPSASPMFENGLTHPTAVGAEIINRMTANRR